ncbi:hypothetical protein PISL3812_02972 [Talaromyces islandicus]|uniref:Uncharacterized protein n=1 Tax=Talaromyces islandicus TaxID=28573 RepID=A0A0U1LRF3_TALIS|nr:hypothetical protein PISL3812_02972 [Talaromyces islandicus]
MASEREGDVATMAVTNGELHPPTDESPVLSTPGKRKRASTPDRNESPIKTAEEDKAELDQTLRYLVQILAKDDEKTELFKCSLTPSSSSPSKPRSKRAKLSDEGSEFPNIEARVAAGRYASLQEFVDDVDKASTAVVENQPSTTGENDESSLQKQILAFKSRLHGLLSQAPPRCSSKIKTETTGEKESLADVAPQHTGRQDKAVLTLYGGNPPNAKQLFSSLQKTNDTSPAASDTSTPLLEDRLPNGITTTQVVPFNSSMDEKPVKTFGEVFAPRSTLPQLEPPRHGRTWGRDPSKTWIDPFDAVTNFDAVLGQRHHYSFTKLPSTHWLQYGGGRFSSPSFWNRRQKQSRGDEGAGSNSYSNSVDDDTVLFQGAYSSFAPSFDSSHAATSLDTKNAVWWAQRGARRFNTVLSFHGAPDTQEEQSILEELDESTLDEDVKSFQPAETQEDGSEVDMPAPEENDSDAILRDITELLETLDSFRRNRNLESPSEADSKDVTPSEAERATYDTLKASLAAIVANLPPYVVSKLNGDQLAELNISQKILVDGPSYSGTMEEDDYSMLQKRISASAPAATPSRSSSYQNAPAFNQRLYSSNTRPQQPGHGGQQYYAGRPSTSTPYTPGTPQQSYTGPRSHASPSQRPSSVPGYPPGQYPPRPPTQNGYGAYTSQPGASPNPGYQQSPAYGAGRSASPQKPPMYSTPQSHTRTAYLNPASGNPQRYYPPQQQQGGQSPAMYGNYSSTQTPGQYSSSTATTNWARNAAEQAILMAQTKAQMEARARQASGTPNPSQSAGQGGLNEGSASPAIKKSATPTPATT